MKGSILQRGEENAKLVLKFTLHWLHNANTLERGVKSMIFVVNVIYIEVKVTALSWKKIIRLESLSLSSAVFKDKLGKEEKIGSMSLGLANCNDC